MLRSVTDTSYFPTDDLNDVPTEPVGADTDSGSKDLAFLGYTVCGFFSFMFSMKFLH
jgi:protein-serine/threonine kinase